MIKLLNILKEETEDYIIPGNIVWTHIISTTPEEGDIPWGFQNRIESRDFKLVDNFDIESILKTDSDYKDYYDSGEVRYDDLDSQDIDSEIVVVDGELLDGYSRVTGLLMRGEKYAKAYVAL